MTDIKILIVQTIMFIAILISLVILDIKISKLYQVKMDKWGNEDKVHYRVSLDDIKDKR